MSRTKRWTVSGVADGYGEVQIIKWRYFMDYIYQRMLDYESYIWRGHRCSNWQLTSTLDRLFDRAKLSAVSRRQHRRDHLEQFKFASRGRRGANPPKVDSDNEWWALGQHHGLATPLLDWTTSPFAAAYFAFINTGAPQTEQRAIFALHRPSIEAKVLQHQAAKEKEKIETREQMNKGGSYSAIGALLLDLPVAPEVEFIRPMSDENQRLVNQSGLFSRAPDDETMESWVKKNFVGDRTYTIMKILIPNRDRAECLRTLNRMNINHLTLFPDLYGASKYCNLYREIAKY